MNDLKELIKQFMPFAEEQMGFDRPPRLFLRHDTTNGADPLGKTGFYDPQSESITIYVTERHPKDILRSLSHELMHHTQNCNGEFENTEGMGEQGYAQNNEHMRNMEIQAYQASIVFRDWEDSLKDTIYYEHLQKGVKKLMSTKNWKNGEISTLLSEAWGFKFNSLKEFEEFDGTGEIQEEVEAETAGTVQEEAQEEVVEEEELEEGSGDRNDPDREQGRDAGHSQRNASDGSAGISEAQIREVAKRVIKRLKETKQNG